ncbi:hypothetical protein [Palleronia sp.]|uniref:hypothetical protein n=1 Tax=Palleronia sp. TaxID=1940284 RepID=UPI0035C7B51C
MQDEWRDNEVTLTCLMPGGTDTPIFHRDDNDLGGTRLAKYPKDDPDKVAQRGYEAVLAGERGAIPGFHNRVLSMLSGIIPRPVVARIHRTAAEPHD